MFASVSGLTAGWQAALFLVAAVLCLVAAFRPAARLDLLPLGMRVFVGVFCWQALARV